MMDIRLRDVMMDVTGRSPVLRVVRRDQRSACHRQSSLYPYGSDESVSGLFDQRFIVHWINGLIMAGSEPVMAREASARFTRS